MVTDRTHDKIPLQVKLSVPLKKRLSKYAEDHNMTMSEVVRKIVARELDYNLTEDDYSFGPKPD